MNVLPMQVYINMKYNFRYVVISVCSELAFKF